MYSRLSTMSLPSWLYFFCAGLLNSSLCSGMCLGTEVSTQRQVVPWCQRYFIYAAFLYILYDKMQNLFIFSYRFWFLLIYKLLYKLFIKWYQTFKGKILIKITLKSNYIVLHCTRENPNSPHLWLHLKNTL